MLGVGGNDHSSLWFAGQVKMSPMTTMDLV